MNGFELVTGELACVALSEFNPGIVQIKEGIRGYLVITSLKAPRDLVYPEGWYYEDGVFQNYKNTVRGNRHSIPMYKQENKLLKAWEGEDNESTYKSDTVKIVKVVDFPKRIMLHYIHDLNFRKIFLGECQIGDNPKEIALLSFREPERLILPKGWYYENGYITNRGSTENICEIPVIRSNGKLW